MLMSGEKYCQTIIQRFHNDIVQKKYTDAQLIIHDGVQTIIMHVHKMYLSLFCEYFEKLFNFGDAITKSEFNIEVADSGIFRDVVLTLYGEKTPEYNACDTFRMIRCRDFLGLPNDVAQLYDLVVPEDDYDFFMDTVDLFDITDYRLLYTIRKNMPINYDLTGLSFDMVQNLVDIKEPAFICFPISKNSMEIIDSTNVVHAFEDYPRNKIGFLPIFSLDGTKMAMINNDGIHIYNTLSGINIQSINTDITGNDSTLIFSLDGNGIALKRSYTLHIWNIMSGQMMGHFKSKHYISCIVYTIDDFQIVANIEGDIHVWNGGMEEVNHRIISYHNKIYACKLCVSPDEISGAAVAGGILYIFNIKSNTIIDKISIGIYIEDFHQVNLSYIDSNNILLVISFDFKLINISTKKINCMRNPDLCEMVYCNGDYFVTSGIYTIYVHDAKSLIGSTSLYQSRIKEYKFSDDCKFVVYGDLHMKNNPIHDRLVTYLHGGNVLETAN
jgi:hypothetical protein